MNNKSQNNSPINCNNINLFHSDNLYRSTPNKKDNKKLNFKTMKNNTICSLNDVECFLNTLQHAFRYIKIYKLFK